MKPIDRILFLESLFRDYTDRNPSVALYLEITKEEMDFRGDPRSFAVAQSFFKELHQWASDKGIR
jgi:hypothetical protein